MPGFSNGIVYFENGIDPRGTPPVVNQMNVDGRLLIGSSASPYVVCNTLTAGEGIDIVNAPGSITINSTGVVQRAFSSQPELVTCTTPIPIDDTIPQITEGDEFISIAFTPKNAAHILNIRVVGTFYTAGSDPTVALFRSDSTDAVVAGELSVFTECFTLEANIVAGTTNPITFSARAGCDGGLAIIYINGDSVGNRLYGGRAVTMISVTEYA